MQTFRSASTVSCARGTSNDVSGDHAAFWSGCTEDVVVNKVLQTLIKHVVAGVLPPLPESGSRACKLQTLANAQPLLGFYPAAFDLIEQALRRTQPAVCPSFEAALFILRQRVEISETFVDYFAQVRVRAEEVHRRNLIPESFVESHMLAGSSALSNLESEVHECRDHCDRTHELSEVTQELSCFHHCHDFPSHGEWNEAIPDDWLMSVVVPPLGYLHEPVDAVDSIVGVCFIVSDGIYDRHDSPPTVHGTRLCQIIGRCLLKGQFCEDRCRHSW